MNTNTVGPSFKPQLCTASQVSPREGTRPTRDCRPGPLTRRRSLKSWCLTRLIFPVALALLAASSAGAFVYESTLEFYATGDFDGDGRGDFVIVDKATGDYRLGYQLTAGNYTWVKARASGMENVSGFSVGHLFSLIKDALVFTAPEANRVNVFDAGNPNLAGLPVSVFPASIGPSLVIAVDIATPPNTPQDDLFVSTILNGGVVTNHLELIRNNAGAFTSLNDQPVTTARGRGNRVLLKNGGPQLAGFVFRSSSDMFVAQDPAAGTVASVSALPAGCSYVFANFDGSAYSQFLFHVPGQSNLLLRPVQEPVAGTFQFGAGASFNLGLAISQVITLPGAGNTRLLILCGQGERARVYDFNGSVAPTLVQEFTAQTGELFTGAGMQGGSNFMMFSGRNGSPTSTSFQSYSIHGASYAAGAGGTLSTLNSLSAAANVFLFERDPFVSPSGNLLRSLNAGDWTSQLGSPLPPPPGQVSVVSESFLDTAQGLRNPSAIQLGTKPAQATFGLVNQYREPISLFSYAPAQGDEIVDLTISPPPGLYQKGIHVTLTAGTTGARIFYRLNPADAWTLYSAPFPLFKNSTVACYARPAAGGAQSRIKTAAYQFGVPPGTLDSDGDGVPDYVELALNTNPNQSDTDLDGLADFDELLRGTNPRDPSSRTNAVERRAVFDLALTPRPYDGTVPGPVLSQTGVVLRAHSLSGSLLAVADTHYLGLSGVTDPAARLTSLEVDPASRLLVASTEEHYRIATPGTDKTIGREMARLVPMPSFSNALAVPYVYGGGDMLVEANNWLAAGRAALLSLPRPLVSYDLGTLDTLVALLVEKKIGELLVSRGAIWGTNITLFPYRPNDVTRSNLDGALLQSLEFRTTNDQPAFLLQTMFRALDGPVKSSTEADVDNLRKVTSDIYRLSSASNNIPAGATNYPAFPSPFDTLRTFLAAGDLHSNYLARSSLTAVQRASARAGMSNLLAAVNGRPTTNLDLAVRNDSFGGSCTPLNTINLAAIKNLVLPGGEPYRLLEALHLPGGSVVRAFGYTDITNASCAGDAIEVISLTLLGVPVASDTDSNGNLLADGWECAFNLTDPFGDADGDGARNLQEFFDGTDPRDAASHFASAIPAAPPAISLSIMPGGSVLLRWSWPAAYAGRVKFGVRSTDELGAVFTEVPIAASDLGGGNFQASLPNPGTTKRFYVLYLSLR